MNKLRTKIFLALAFLFMIIVVLGFIGSSFIKQLAADSSHIIQDNYASAQYATNMLRTINRIYSFHAERDLLKHDALLAKTENIHSLLDEFERNLKAEESNVTEAGEVELVGELRKNYSEFVYILQKMNTAAGGDSQIAALELLNKYENLQNTLHDIYKLNTAAILKKNNRAANTAEKVSMYMLIISIISSIIALVFILYLPKYLVRPIHELTGKIRQISEGNYNQQLNLHSNDELGELSLAFNNMSSRLMEYFKERDSAKTNLIATVSHELKTPISSINLSLKLLENEKVGATNQEQKQIMQSIRQQTSRLSKMVNELLDYSQAESGNIKLKIERAAVPDIIDYAAVAMVMIIAEKKIQLETCIDDNLPFIQADIEKTVWVLVNLINNAVRYTPESGTIKITAQKEKDFVVISVVDQGPGISSEDQEKIFSKFVQVGNQNPRGRGLGLAISKEFVISQGGDIWVESEMGMGSRFSFKLPAE